MNDFKYLSLLILGFFANPASGNEPVNFPEVDGWELSVYEDVYTPGNLWDLINGAAESYLAYDFVDLHLADYENSSGITIHAEVYRHSSLNNAYGIYASERSPDYSFIDLGAQAYSDEGILNLFTGPYYIKLYSTDEHEAIKEGLQTVGKALVRAQDQGDMLPGLLSLFPEDGKLPYSDQYIAQNFIGFDFLHSAFTSTYEEGYRLFVIQGKDADEILKMVRSYLDFTKQDINLSAESHFVIQDPYNGHVPVIIAKKYLIGILEGPENRNARMGLAELERNLRSLE
jgi:hypothetical protein